MPDDFDDGYSDSDAYDSGPFCRHWRDPSDCEETCKCGHLCGRHSDDDCREPGCDCDGFVNVEED